MDSETRVQALRGAAGAKTSQCGKPRLGDSKCSHLRAVPVPKKDREKGLGKTGASRRGNTSSSSGDHFYWA